MFKLSAAHARGLVLGGVVGVLAAGGGAYAMAASGAGTINVCVHRHGGALYRAAHCARQDSSLSWNVAGPQGAKGATGATGSAGVTNIYSTGSDLANTTIQGLSTDATVESLSLPAGSYYLSATADAFIETAGDAVICRLGTPGKPVSTLTEAHAIAPANGASVPLELSTAVTLSAPTTEALICQSPQHTADSYITVMYGHLTAIQATHLNQQ